MGNACAVIVDFNNNGWDVWFPILLMFSRETIAEEIMFISLDSDISIKIQQAVILHGMIVQ